MVLFIEVNSHVTNKWYVASLPASCIFKQNGLILRYVSIIVRSTINKLWTAKSKVVLLAAMYVFISFFCLVAIAI